MSTKEAMDLGGSRRRGSGPKAGSVWESRMKIDGGFKVFNATHDTSQENTQNPSISTSTSTTVNNPEIQMDKKMPKQSPGGKRKTWKSESLEGSPVKIASLRSELSKNFDENCKELSVSPDGIKKSPLPIKKTRSGLPNQSTNGNKKNAIQLRKVKSDFTEVNSDSKSEGNFKKSISLQLEKAESVVERENLDEDSKSSDDREDRKEVDLCEEKAITSDGDQSKNPSDNDGFVDGEIETDLDDDDDEEEEDGGERIEVESKSLEIKEITIQDHRPKKIVIEEKKLIQKIEKPVPISPIVKKQLQQPPAAVNHARFHPTPTKINSISDSSNEVPRTSSNLQRFVDLVMWRDVSKSAFVFGIGTFAIISSSYTKDLNISFISVISYLGLVYLAAIFLFRSLITRGWSERENDNEDCVVREEEAIWVAKLVVPYVNEFVLKLRALFSGDPATTTKLALLLFVLARCGGSITIWKMAKLGFIGVFTVPKLCSTYSSHLNAYGTFWIRRFRDAWDSCSHKKAVGFGIFTLIWNFSSIIARIWAVFMLFAAFKYYQQSAIKAEEGSRNGENSSWQRQEYQRTTIRA